MTKDTPFTSAELNARVLRYDQLIPCKTAFIDAKTPGSDKKENFCLIGPGVAENPDQHIHIQIPHGFNIGAAKQPRGCKNSHHSHETEEVFMVHKGRWKFTWGEEGQDGEAVLEEGDTLSIPTNVFRGFENVGDDDGFLFCVLGKDDPGHVLWAPYVFDKAKDHGLVMLEGGGIIDTTQGQEVPAGANVAVATSKDQASALTKMSLEQMAECIVTNDEVEQARAGGMSQFSGFEEFPIIGQDADGESMPAAKINWRHGFQLRRLKVAEGAESPDFSRGEAEVIFVHKGQLKVSCEQGEVLLDEGDLFTVPKGLIRRFSNPGTGKSDVLIVRQFDQATAIQLN